MDHYNHGLEICSLSHELLISIAKTATYLPPLTVFHHWNSVHVQSYIPASISSNALPLKVGHAELKLLHALRDLGSSQLLATDISSPARIHDYLPALIDPLAASDSDSDPISTILTRLQTTSLTFSLQPGFVFVQFLALVVHSYSSDGLFSDQPVPVWKWFIPADPSLPMRRTLWKPDLADLLKYPAWSPKGRQHLLLQGVSEERAEKLRRSMVLFPASEENVVLLGNSENAGGHINEYMTHWAAKLWPRESKQQLQVSFDFSRSLETSSILL